MSDPETFQIKIPVERAVNTHNKYIYHLSLYQFSIEIEAVTYHRINILSTSFVDVGFIIQDDISMTLEIPLGCMKVDDQSSGALPPTDVSDLKPLPTF